MVESECVRQMHKAQQKAVMQLICIEKSAFLECPPAQHHLAARQTYYDLRKVLQTGIENESNERKGNEINKNKFIPECVSGLYELEYPCSIP